MACSVGAPESIERNHEPLVSKFYPYAQSFLITIAVHFKMYDDQDHSDSRPALEANSADSNSSLPLYNDAVSDNAFIQGAVDVAGTSSYSVISESLLTLST